MKKLALLLALICSTASAADPDPSKLTIENYNKIEVGKTTLPEAHKVLGKETITPSDFGWLKTLVWRADDGTDKITLTVKNGVVSAKFSKGL